MASANNSIKSTTRCAMFRTMAARTALCYCLFCAALAVAQPLFPQSGIALGAMDRDGDLLVRLPITVFKTQSGEMVEVSLAHKQEVGDYGNARSRFILQPFESGIEERADNGVTWWPLYGLEVEFSSKRRKSQPSEPPALLKAQGVDVIWDMMKIDDVRLWWGASNLALIEQAKWQLVYRDGGLAAIKAPRESEIAVTSIGRRATEWKQENRTLAKIEWDRRTPRRIHTPGASYTIHAGSRGRIQTVVDDKLGIEIIRIHYDVTGMVRRIWTLGEGEIIIDWRRNAGYGRGDSFYRKPCSISRMGSSRYWYHRDGNVINMSMAAGDGVKHTLNWKIVNGQIVSVSGK